jgi:hypothetical protein
MGSRRKSTPTEQERASKDRLRIHQLENDLAACRKHRVEDEKEITNLRLSNAVLTTTRDQVIADRDDWKSAFKLIMKLVK